MSVGVIGAGAFGTALAISLSRNGPVDLWSRSETHANAMRADRENRSRLPGVALPDALRVTSDITRVAGNRILLLAVPMQQLRSVLQAHAPDFRDRFLVACCKGIELDSGIGPLGVISSLLPAARAALLTGPSFAHDIARGLPTALTLACKDGDLGKALQHELTTANLRLYRTRDVTGAEFGGALKNVVAIACGSVIGAGLGESARAALMTRGYAEMRRMAIVLGAEPETLAGLSGFGDLALTCTSDLSRNYRLGLTLGRGETFDSSVTVEGVATARAVATKAAAMGLEMPITQSVVGLLAKELTITDAMADLLSRPLKEE
ncbi:NAD(P)H-dependent glycerol-3-phosphate dehydrogenase [Sedimentitalea sp. JM2-8]|uniref:Glycerol-3-phosphate dehydrogenase [NAD(P)+] n=1 Tax=Sedimentitalea xiamensis TaxID=3050037 RepID=A0ABT7FA16_9RHOB|nr:NAD(P)H-dependent glycerol-3-phosphate dehydrogenase [Sedimentitalea xiamensis]MDK3071810.1 NAD(P)H-dependent glycerol-3-phosphate dehydrogenase [Sedimentitalea xiamensis]